MMDSPQATTNIITRLNSRTPGPNLIFLSSFFFCFFFLAYLLYSRPCFLFSSSSSSSSSSSFFFRPSTAIDALGPAPFTPAPLRCSSCHFSRIIRIPNRIRAAKNRIANSAGLDSRHWQQKNSVKLGTTRYTVDMKWAGNESSWL